MAIQKWKAIKSAMAPDRRARIDADVRRELLAMDLRELRKEAGKTQAEVAEIAEMTQAELSKLERRDDHLLDAAALRQGARRRARGRGYLRQEADTVAGGVTRRACTIPRRAPPRPSTSTASSSPRSKSCTSSTRLVLAVSHKQYLELPIEQLTGMLRKGGLLLDVKSALDSGACGGGRAVLESLIRPGPRVTTATGPGFVLGHPRTCPRQPLVARSLGKSRVCSLALRLLCAPACPRRPTRSWSTCSASPRR